MKKYILTIGVNPSLDKTVETDSFKTNAENRARVVELVAGGKAINVARALSRMKQNAHTALVVGTGPSGTFIKDAVARESFGSSFCTVSQDSRTNLTVRCESKETRILERGPALSHKECTAIVRLCTEAMDTAACVVISGRTAAGLDDDFYARIIRAAQKRGILTALDTSGSALRNGIDACPDIVKPNIKEAEELLGTKLSSKTKIVAALRRLHSMGIATPIITAGSNGAYAFDGMYIVHTTPPPLKDIVTTVGCGDCFLAGFIAARSQGKDLADSMRQATAWAAANTQETVHGNIAPVLTKKLFHQVSISVCA